MGYTDSYYTQVKGTPNHMSPRTREILKEGSKPYKRSTDDK